MYLISACLAGVNCKYSGGNNDCPWVREFMEGKDYMLFCPEEAGGLPTPRPPAEFRDGRVFNKNGEDITDYFIRGAEKTMEAAERRAAELGQEIELAISKANSPSCGSGTIYDGTFSGITVEGDGMFVKLLKERGIPVLNEHQREEAEQLAAQKCK
jgi:uncharacterized protein YbbK (DUF523 family)